MNKENKEINDLRNLIDLNGLHENPIVGTEYYINSYRATGIYIGKKYNNYTFIATSKRTAIIISHGSRYHEEIVRDFLTQVSNVKNLTLFYVPRGFMFTPIKRTDAFKSNLQTKLLTDRSLTNILDFIINSSAIGSYDYKIARFLKSSLLRDISEVNDIGFITVISDDKNVQLFTLKKERIDKTLNKISKIIDDSRNNVTSTEIDTLVFNSFEQTKIGRIVKRVSGKLFPDDKIESFVNTFTAFSIKMNTYDISLIKGNDIPKWYNGKTYTKDNHSTLQNSCMRHSNLESQWSFYAKHPNCEMIILTKGGSLHARALVWTLKDGTKYLDRIYFSYPKEAKIIENWAKKNNINDSYAAGVKKDLFVETYLGELHKKNPGIGVPYIDTFTAITSDLKYMVRFAASSSERKKEDIIYSTNQNYLNLTRGVDLEMCIEYIDQWIVKEGQCNAVNKSSKWVKVPIEKAKYDKSNNKMLVKEEEKELI